jgi:hypothetical protein
MKLHKSQLLSSMMLFGEISPALCGLLGICSVLLIQHSSLLLVIQFPSVPNRGCPERTTGAGGRG